MADTTCMIFTIAQYYLYLATSTTLTHPRKFTQSGTNCKCMQQHDPPYREFRSEIMRVGRYALLSSTFSCLHVICANKLYQVPLHHHQSFSVFDLILYSSTNGNPLLTKHLPILTVRLLLKDCIHRVLPKVLSC